MLKILFVALGLCICLFTKAQGDDLFNNPLKGAPLSERLYTGGNVGFKIVRDVLFFDISPILGYKITPKLSAGVGGKYTLIRDLTFKVNYSIYGGSVFSRYLLFPQLFVHTEYELLNAYDLAPLSPTYGDRALANMFFAGAGYTTGGRGLSVQLMLLYDFIDDVNSPYQNAYLLGAAGPPIIIRGGINIGL